MRRADNLSTFMCRLSGNSGNLNISVGERFPAIVHAGPGAHPGPYTMFKGCLFLGLKRPGHGVNHPPPSRAEVKEREELYFYSISLVLHGLL